MDNFHKTPIGRKFYDSQVPKIISALEKIADNLEKLNKLTEKGNKLDEMLLRKQVKQINENKNS